MGNSFIQTTNLTQFNLLMQELIQGGPKRTVFQPWEMALLLDFGSCRMRQSARPEFLKRYQRMVQHHFLRGQYQFPTLSMFLAEERAKRARAKEQQAAVPSQVEAEMPCVA